MHDEARSTARQLLECGDFDAALAWAWLFSGGLRCGLDTPVPRGMFGDKMWRLGLGPQYRFGGPTCTSPRRWRADFHVGPHNQQTRAVWPSAVIATATTGRWPVGLTAPPRPLTQSQISHLKCQPSSQLRAPSSNLQLRPSTKPLNTLNRQIRERREEVSRIPRSALIAALRSPNPGGSVGAHPIRCFGAAAWHSFPQVHTRIQKK